MNPQTEQDIHLIATPFRLVGEWLKIAIFILILPVVGLISFIYWLVTGEPMMSYDEHYVAQILISVLMPFIITILWIIYQHIRENRTGDRSSVVCSYFVVFPGSIIGTILGVKFLCMNRLYYCWFYPEHDANTFVTLLPLMIVFAVFGAAVMLTPHTFQEQAEQKMLARLTAEMQAERQAAIERMYGKIGAPNNCLWCGVDQWAPGSFTHIQNKADLTELIAQHGKNCPWAATEGRPYLKLSEAEYNRIMGF